MLLLRLAVLFLGSLVVGASVAVMLAYAQAYRVHRRVLARHVMIMAASYTMAICGLMVGMWMFPNFGRGIAALATMGLGFYGLVSMFRYQMIGGPRGGAQ